MLASAPSGNLGDFMRHSDVENLRSLPPPRSFTGSALFERTFDEGMALVEETARYLDGPGRDEARALAAQGRDALCGRKHARHHPPDAGGKLASGAARGA